MIREATEDDDIGAMKATFVRDCTRQIGQFHLTPDMNGWVRSCALVALAQQILSAPIYLRSFHGSHEARIFSGRHGFLWKRFAGGAAHAKRCPDLHFTFSAKADFYPVAGPSRCTP